MQFGVETKKLWSFEDERAKLSGNFTVETPFGRVFRSCKTTLWHTSATLQCHMPISQLRNGLRKSPSSTKSSPRCGNDLQASKMGCDLLFYVSFFLLDTKWIQNDLQASKWLRKCSRHQNGLRNSHLAAKCFCSPIATPCEIPLGLRKCFYFFHEL